MSNKCKSLHCSTDLCEGCCEEAAKLQIAEEGSIHCNFMRELQDDVRRIEVKKLTLKTQVADCVRRE